MVNDNEPANDDEPISLCRARALRDMRDIKEAPSPVEVCVIEGDVHLSADGVVLDLHSARELAELLWSCADDIECSPID